MKRRTILVMAVLAIAPGLVTAQVSWSGIYDIEIKKGGRGSSWERNELPNDHVQIDAQRIEFFLDAAVDEDITLSGKIATNKRTGIRGIDVELASVTFWNLADKALNFSAGKIVTPFGSFARRQLSPQNPLIGNPLFFHYVVPVSPFSGYLDSAGVLLAQSLYGGSLTTIYNGGYYVGVEAFGGFADDLVQYDFAVMNAPLSSSNSGVNLDKRLAFHGRVALQPAMWATLGASYSIGSFLEKASVNGFYDSRGGIEQFKQRTVGLDVNLNYVFYEINAEYIVNRFSAPYIVYDYLLNPPYKSGLTGANEIVLSSGEVLVDVKIDVPFVPGCFVAGRLNTVLFGMITDPSPASATYQKQIRWDRNVRRYAAAVGYKAARRVLVKIGYEWTVIEVNPRPFLDVIATQLSVSF